MLTYLQIDLIILAFPLLFSFTWKFRYYRFWKPLAASTAIVGGAFIIWDAIATARGDWWFDEEYVLGVELLGLPLEEVLFFIVVPYACIFIYENLVYFVPDAKVPFPRELGLGLALAFGGAAFLFRYQEYTVLAMMSCAAFFLFSSLWYPAPVRSRNFWLYMGLSFIAFMVFNYLLTSITIVHYNPEAIWNVRVTTIPLEDFFYNFSMLSFYLAVYVYFRRRWKTGALAGEQERKGSVSAA